MNIRDAHINPNRSEHLRNDQINGAGRVNNQGANAPGADQAHQAGKDRVEISEAGRAAASDTQTRELNFARKALDGVSSLPEERVEAIHQRIQDGYYQQPDVIRQIATSVAINLANNRQA
jgi:anti-sigma28 factor (negative regulator of flagellin synthesis)